MDRKFFANFSIPPFSAEQGWYEQRKLLVGNIASVTSHDDDDDDDDSPVLPNGQKTSIRKGLNTKVS